MLLLQVVLFCVASDRDMVVAMTKYWGVTCKNKDCGKPILDTVYSGPGVVRYRVGDPLQCPVCGHTDTYAGIDFKVMDGPYAV